MNARNAITKLATAGAIAAFVAVGSPHTSAGIIIVNGSPGPAYTLPNLPLPPIPPDVFDDAGNPDDPGPRGHVDIPEIDREPPKDGGDPGENGPAGASGPGIFGGPFDLYDLGGFDKPIRLIEPQALPSIRSENLGDLIALPDAMTPIDAPTTISAPQVPGPGTALLVGLGALAASRRRR